MPEPSHLSLPPTLGDGSFIPRHTQSRRKQGSRHGSEHFTAALSPSSWLPCPASLQAPCLEKQVPGPPHAVSYSVNCSVVTKPSLYSV